MSVLAACPFAAPPDGRRQRPARTRSSRCFGLAPARQLTRRVVLAMINGSARYLDDARSLKEQALAVADDALDVELAERRLREVDEHPEKEVSGDALDQRLRRLLS